MLAVQALFELDFHNRPPDDAVEERLGDAGLSPANQAFVYELVHGVLDRKQEIDDRLAAAAPQWPIEQIAHVDKNVLRLAIYELMSGDNPVPAKGGINEAGELARLLGSGTSPKFVNGVLGAVMAEKEVN